MTKNLWKFPFVPATWFRRQDNVMYNTCLYYVIWTVWMVFQEAKSLESGTLRPREIAEANRHACRYERPSSKRKSVGRAGKDGTIASSFLSPAGILSSLRALLSIYVMALTHDCTETDSSIGIIPRTRLHNELLYNQIFSSTKFSSRGTHSGARLNKNNGDQNRMKLWRNVIIIIILFMNN